MIFKRLTSAALFLIFTFAIFSASALAADTETYTLEDIGMKISFPSELIRFPRGFDKDDPNLAAYGLVAESLEMMMSSRNIYMDAFNQEASFEILVTMYESPLKDFNSLSDDLLTIISASYPAEFENMGITCTKTELYQSPQDKFTKTYTSQPFNGSTVVSIQYSTVVDGKNITMIMNFYSGQVTEIDEAYLKTIVDSAIFDASVPIAGKDAKQIRASRYADSQTNVAFTVPANWNLVPESSTSGLTEAVFSMQDGSIDTITFSSKDLWSQLTESEKTVSRRDYDNSKMTPADMAKEYGQPVSEISTVTYNDCVYFKHVATSTDTSLGFDLQVQTTRLWHIENGYLYAFQFTGTPSSKHSADFEALINSVKYPSVIWALFAEKTLASLLLSSLIFIAVYSLPIILYRYAIRRRPVNRNAAKIITLVYGLCAFILICLFLLSIAGSVLLSGVILLWSLVIYKILIRGKSAPLPPANATSGSAL